MSMRLKRGLLAAAALSFLAAGSLQATAAMAADGSDRPVVEQPPVRVETTGGSDRPVVEQPPVRGETADASGRPVTDNPSYRPIWCTDVETGEVFQCGWQS